MRRSADPIAEAPGNGAGDGDEHLPLFAVTAPGLEPLAVAELGALGIEAVAETGGAAWVGTRSGLYAANLHLRTASRVLLRIAEFRARTFFELERHARKVEWSRFLTPGRTVRLRVSSRKSRLYHEGAVAQRLLDAIGRRVGSVPVAGALAEEAEEEGAGEQLFVVRFHYDRCTVSVDASGALLHLRGYRQAVARAPLRETLAASILIGSGWDARSALLDPMCGSGTIAIEGALMARDIAPGIASAGLVPRAFAFEEWPDFDPEVWRALVDRAREAVRPAAQAPILGSDRDAGAVEAARANAARAGVSDDLVLQVRPLSSAEVPAQAGWLVTNPPYGVRVGDTRDLRDLYAALGQMARRSLSGWTIAVLSADRPLERQMGLPLQEALRTRNGGIPVRLMVARV